MEKAFPATLAPSLTGREPASFGGLEPWLERMPPEKRRLGLYLLAALLAHLAFFWSIQIDTPPLEQPRAAQSQITFAAPPTDAGGDLWGDLADPRLFLDRAPLASGSWGNPTPTDPLRELFPPALALAPPAPALPGDFSLIPTQDRPLAERVREGLRPPRAEVETPPVAVLAATKTLWQWSTDLAGRHPTAIPELPALTSDTELRPTQLRLAVDRAGAVAAVLIEPALGETPGLSRADLEQMAVLAARKVRFAPAPAGGPDWQWGTVTIAWYYTAPPREVVEPTPPSGP